MYTVQIPRFKFSKCVQTRKRTVTSSFSFQSKCCQISPAIDPERKITSRDLFSAPALRSFFRAWQWAFQGDRTEKLGTLGHSRGREGLGPHLECVHCPGPLTSVTDCSASPASFSLLLSLHLGSCISHPLYIVTLHMLCMALNDNAFYYWLHSLFNLQSRMKHYKVKNCNFWACVLCNKTCLENLFSRQG